MACTVLPRPMSSARIPPTRRSLRRRSQPWPALLEREEVVAHARRRRQRAEASLSRRGEQLVERLVEPHLPELDPRFVRLQPAHGAHELDDADRAAALVDESERPLDLGRAERVPLAAEPHQRLLRGRELRQLVLGQLHVPDREPPVERGDRVGGEQAARHGRRAGRDEVDRDAARRGDPLAGQSHRDAELLEPRHRLAQERSGLGGVELDGARRIALELDPDRREDRLDQLQAQLERAPGVALAEEREHVVAAFAQQAGRECERRVVRRLEPELEDDRRRLGAARTSASSSRRPRFHGARERRDSPSSTQVLSRRSSAG